jgi:hypothetical protein
VLCQVNLPQRLDKAAPLFFIGKTRQENWELQVLEKRVCVCSPRLSRHWTGTLRMPACRLANQQRGDRASVRSWFGMTSGFRRLKCRHSRGMLAQESMPPIGSAIRCHLRKWGQLERWEEERELGQKKIKKYKQPRPFSCVS